MRFLRQYKNSEWRNTVVECFKQTDPLKFGFNDGVKQKIACVFGKEVSHFKIATYVVCWYTGKIVLCVVRFDKTELDELERLCLFSKLVERTIEPKLQHCYIQVYVHQQIWTQLGISITGTRKLQHESTWPLLCWHLFSTLTVTKYCKVLNDCRYTKRCTHPSIALRIHPVVLQP